MNKIETTKHNSTILNPDWLKDSGLTPTVWEQAQLSQDLVQSLDDSNNAASLTLEQIDSLIGQSGIGTLSFTPATKADIKASKTITKSLNDIADPLLNPNNFTSNSSSKVSNSKTSAASIIAQATYDPNYDITTRFFVEGGSRKLALANIDGERVDPRRRGVEFDLIQDKRAIPGSQTWVIIHGWNGELGQFQDLGEAVQRARPNDTVLVLNWRQAALTKGGSNVFGGGNYFAATWIRPVAEGVVNALTRWGVNPGALNLIGHSLGAYVSSEIGRVFVEETGRRVRSYLKITKELDKVNQVNLG
jgi:hypothetical protein